jgi:hypothetical protein
MSRPLAARSSTPHDSGVPLVLWFPKRLSQDAYGRERPLKGAAASWPTPARRRGDRLRNEQLREATREPRSALERRDDAIRGLARGQGMSSRQIARCPSEP